MIKIENHVLKEIIDDVVSQEKFPMTISQQLKEYVDRAIDFEKKIADLENKLLIIKQSYRTLMYQELPVFFSMHGLREFKTIEGRVFSLKTYVSTKPGNKEVFINWLEESGNEEFIKKEITINVKGYNTGLLETVLEKEKLKYDIEEKVHPQTLNAIIRRALENGETIPENAVTIDSGSFVKLT